MITRTPVRFRTPILVLLLLAAADSNAAHCSAGETQETPSIMVQVFPCNHDNKGHYAEPDETPAIYDAGNVPAGINAEETESGGYDTTNVEISEDESSTMMTLEQHKKDEQRDARREWAQVNKQLFKRFPQDTRINPDGTVIFPEPPKDAEDWCMYDKGDNNRYPQPLEIDGDTGNIKLKYHHGESITFRGVGGDTSTTMEEKEALLKNVEHGNTVGLACRGPDIFGKCLDFVIPTPPFGSHRIGGHKLVLRHDGREFRIHSFRPVNAPTYDGGTYGNTGPVTRWQMIKVVDPEKATLRLESVPQKNELRPPGDCEEEGEEEYWTLYCSGETRYTSPQQPSSIPCCPDPCEDDDPAEDPIEET